MSKHKKDKLPLEPTSLKSGKIRLHSKSALDTKDLDVLECLQEFGREGGRVIMFRTTKQNSKFNNAQNQPILEYTVSAYCEHDGKTKYYYELHKSEISLPTVTTEIIDAQVSEFGTSLTEKGWSIYSFNVVGPTDSGLSGPSGPIAKILIETLAYKEYQ